MSQWLSFIQSMTQLPNRTLLLTLKWKPYTKQHQHNQLQRCHVSMLTFLHHYLLINYISHNNSTVHCDGQKAHWSLNDKRYQGAVVKYFYLAVIHIWNIASKQNSSDIYRTQLTILSSHICLYLCKYVDLFALLCVGMCAVCACRHM